MLELYIHRNSPIHKIPAIIKMMAMVFISILIFHTNSPAFLTFFLIFSMMLFYIAKLPWKKFLTEFRFIFFYIAIILTIHCIFNSFSLGIIIGLRFLNLMLFASIVTLTTQSSKIIKAIEKVLYPLTIFGLNTAKLTMAISLSIRFIPVLIEQMNRIQEAQKARGLDGNIVAIIFLFLSKPYIWQTT